MDAALLFVCVLLAGALGQPAIDPAPLDQMSSMNPATDPNGCDQGARQNHVGSIINNLPASLTTNGGAVDRLDTVLLGRNASNPATSCTQIYNLDPNNSPSGNYWLRSQVDGTSVSVYCDMDITCGCSSQRGWTRVQIFNMSDPNTNCPSQWRLLASNGKRACGKTTNGWGWNAQEFNMGGVPYQRVCGKIIGLLFGSPDAFNRWASQKWRTVNDVYFDGVDVVYGAYDHGLGKTQFTHIWSNAGSFSDYRDFCPCGTNSNRPVPTFIGSNYYCEGGGIVNAWSPSLKTNDPLWDGMMCVGPEAPCCIGAPQFCRSFSSQITDNIYIRLMTDQGWNDEDVTVSYYELYVQ